MHSGMPEPAVEFIVHQHGHAKCPSLQSKSMRKCERVMGRIPITEVVHRNRHRPHVRIAWIHTRCTTREDDASDRAKAVARA